MKLLGFAIAESFLVYLAIATFAVAVWIIDRILHKLEGLRRELNEFIRRDAARHGNQGS